MSRSDDKRIITNQVTKSTIDLHPIARKVGNTTVLLSIPGISEENNALNLILDILWKLRDGVVDDGGSLTVECSVRIKVLWRWSQFHTCIHLPRSECQDTSARLL